MVTQILVADDSLYIRLAFRKLLNKEEYRINEVEDGNSAYNELRSNNYDLCLLDIMMPGRNGIEILKALRKNDRIDTKVILITGSLDIDNVIQSLRLGVYDYIKKPFSLTKIKSIIQTAIEKRKLELQSIKYKENLKYEVEEKNSELTSAYRDIITAISNSIETRDIYTGKHAHKVCDIMIEFGKFLKCDSKILQEMEVGAMLHDIGKIGIADNILKKPGVLTQEEYSEIKQHPVTGYNIIKNIQSLKNIIPYVLHHHERYDGNGYPDGLKEDEIPVESRILAIADSFEAMTADRPYRKKFSAQKAFKEITNNAGTQFDTEYVEIFEKLLKKKKMIKVHNT